MTSSPNIGQEQTLTFAPGSLMLKWMRSLLLSILVLSAWSVAAQDVRHHAKGAVELGWNYFNKGDQGTALKRFNQALVLDPDFAPAYFGIAYVYSTQNKLDLAIQFYRMGAAIIVTNPHGLVFKLKPSGCAAKLRARGSSKK